MITRELFPEDQATFDGVINHPLQSWMWGNFRQKTGVEVVRVGTFTEEKLLSGFQLTFHQIPYTPFTVGYFPKGNIPDRNMILALKKIGINRNAIFIKIEPNVIAQNNKTIRQEDTQINNKSHNSLTVSQSSHLNILSLIPSHRSIFTKYTFYIDLTRSEEELLKNMHPKTRYNIRVAQKHGVTIQEENTLEAFQKYLELTRETCRRQGFYAHTDAYHHQMWETLQPCGIAHLFTARYQGEILATWILFLFKNFIYYPYGASSEKNKEVMVSNLMMWEAIKWGKKMNAKTFDLWGTPGPNPLPTNPYYGFHRFKQGYGPQLIEFIGSYDLVLKPFHYILYNFADKIRWAFLNFKSILP